jgi:hypothetical protein
MAMCVGGPPNPVQPIRPHCRSTVRVDGISDASWPARRVATA